MLMNIQYILLKRNLASTEQYDSWSNVTLEEENIRTDLHRATLLKTTDIIV